MAGLIIAATALFLGATARAAVVNVSVINFAFSPAVTNVNVGDKVVWVWATPSNNHNVVSTSATQAWPASPVKSNPYSFTNQFNSAGSFPYECSVHGFTGTINVTAVVPPNTPPTVTITNPAANAVFAAPANITIAATAADSDGTVASVQFFLGSTAVGTVTARPYTVVASGVPAGASTITAIATDNQGGKSTNSVAVNVVTPVATAISAPQASATNFVFTFNATVGLSYVVQATPDLGVPNWVDVFTNAPATNATVTVELPVSTSANYYRVGRLPNP
jgi:plastocyanin